MSTHVSLAEREEMLRLRLEGMNNVAIAKAVKRTHTSVTNSIGPPGSTSKEATWRKCNLCGKQFFSEWYGNRKCGTCLKTTRAWSSSMEP